MRRQPDFVKHAKLKYRRRWLPTDKNPTQHSINRWAGES
jgi:hypothetical protein